MHQEYRQRQREAGVGQPDRADRAGESRGWESRSSLPMCQPLHDEAQQRDGGDLQRHHLQGEDPDEEPVAAAEVDPDQGVGRPAPRPPSG